jgi:hypothetical protein
MNKLRKAFKNVNQQKNILKLNNSISIQLFKP